MKKIDEAPTALVVGYECATNPEAMEKLQPVEPDGRLKDPEKIQASIAQRERDRAENFCQYKVTGSITRAYVVNPAAGEAYDTASSNKEQPAAVTFWSWFKRRFPNAVAGTPHSPVYNVVLFGFGAPSFVKIAGVEAMHAGCDVDLGFWYGNSAVFDPYYMLTEDKATRPVLEHEALLRHFGIGVLPVPVYTPHEDAMSDAVYATELLVRMGAISLDGAACVALEELRAGLYTEDTVDDEEAATAAAAV